jgi:hypothetical protein
MPTSVGWVWLVVLFPLLGFLARSLGSPAHRRGRPTS